MANRKLLRAFILFIMLVPSQYGCRAQANRPANSISSLRFLGEYIVPYNDTCQRTTIGGISGIDYNQVDDEYYLISDDRSAINPARFYTAKIKFTNAGFKNIQFINARFFLQPDGSFYPSAKQNTSQAIDPESIRFNARTKQMVWVSEGEKIEKDEQTILTDPSIRYCSTTGEYTGALSLPENLKMRLGNTGPRVNETLESISFTNDFTELFIALEGPRAEDGPRADVTKTDSWIRIYNFNLMDSVVRAQYAYKLERVAYAPADNGFRVNGVSEILSVGKNRLLMIERSFSYGRLPCTIKIFLADLEKADDISKIESLIENPPDNPAKKKLLLNMDDLGIHIDNVEGVTFGPALPNGHKTLVFVADNNFKENQKTQFLLFEVVP